MIGAASNSIGYPGRAGQTDERASEFLIRRYDMGGWSDADQAELDGWLDETLSHRTSYWRLKAAWMRANRLDALRPLSPLGGAVGSFSVREWPGTAKFKLVAAVALLSLLGTAVWLTSQTPTSRTFATAVGERSNLQLPDGSRVELTTNTTLRVSSDAAIRKVWLDKGEAFFRVVHDIHRPFVIHALDFQVVDLGTEFSIRRDPSRIEVMVLRGSVRIDPPAGSGQVRAVAVSAGEMAIADNHSISIRKKARSEMVDALGWRNGILVFRRTPLSEVAVQFNRYNSEKIVIDEPRVSDLTISARLPATDVGAFARVAKNFLGLKIKKHGDEVHISRQEK